MWPRIGVEQVVKTKATHDITQNKITFVYIKRNQIIAIHMQYIIIQKNVFSWTMYQLSGSQSDRCSLLRSSDNLQFLKTKVIR